MDPDLEEHLPFALEECPPILANFLGRYPIPGMQRMMWYNIWSIYPILNTDHGEGLLDTYYKAMEMANLMERAEAENVRWIELPSRIVARIRRELTGLMAIVADYTRELTGFDHGKFLFTPHLHIHIGDNGLHHHPVFQAEAQAVFNGKYRYFSTIAQNPFLTELEFFWLECMADIIASAHARVMGVQNYTNVEDALADLMDTIAGWSIVPRPLTPPATDSSSGEGSDQEDSLKYDWTLAWEGNNSF